MKEALSMSNRMTFEDTHNATSSRGLEDGLMLSGSLNGQTINQCGREAHHVNLGQMPMSSGLGSETNVTLPHISPASSESASLQSSLENRLRERYAKDGLIHSLQIWKRSVTPAGRQYCQLSATAQSMNAKEFIGWATPNARDGKDISRSNAFLASRARHSPSMATRLLSAGVIWTQLMNFYCLAMGYPLDWNDCSPKDLEMLSSRKSRRSS